MERRWRKGEGYKKQVFYRAIEKYGWDNIDHEIIASNLTKEEAEQKEIELIAELHSNEKEFGYNVSNGGNAIGKHSEETKQKIRQKKKGSSITEEARQKISEKNRGKEVSSDTRKRIGDAKRGDKHHLYGKHHKEETKERMREASMGGKNGRARKVICEEVEYDCIKECAEAYGVNKDTMRFWLSGKNKMPQNFIDMGLHFKSERTKV